MVKLVSFVAEDVNFDLTRGWYKYGVFSPNAYIIAKDGSDGDLMSLELPKMSFQKKLKISLSRQNLLAYYQLLKKWKSKLKNTIVKKSDYL